MELKKILVGLEGLKAKGSLDVDVKHLDSNSKNIKDGDMFVAIIPQGEDFSMAPMLNKEMSKINWNSQSAQEIKNLVRGLNPIMGTYSYLNDKKIKFWKVDVLPFENENVENGTILKSNSKDGLYIKAKDGMIKVLEIQGENSKRMPIQDFLRGNELEEGKRFE